MKIEDLLGGADIGQLMNQAKEMQQQVADAQARAASKSATGEAGGGLVTVEVNGKLEVLAVEIDPSVLASEDREMLQDLIAAATNLALGKARALMADELGPLASMMQAGGLSP